MAAKAKTVKRKTVKQSKKKTSRSASAPAKRKRSGPDAKNTSKEVATDTRAGAPASSAGGPGTVSIRMYRGLLGDFFLVRHAIGSRVFKMLIDCGVLQCIGSEAAKPSTARGKKRIVANVADFINETGGHVDLVVATHEHFDHLSGFILAREKFENFTIGKVWMAWTEDRTDKLANGYRAKTKKALSALVSLALNPALAASGDSMQTVSDLLQFYGGLESLREDALGLAKPADDGNLSGNASCEAVLTWLRKRAGAGNVSFLKPGDVVRWGLDDVFRAYVLGPPRDDELLRKLNPSKANSEVYLARSEDVETVMSLAAIHGQAGAETDGKEQPFTRLHQRPYGRDKKRDGEKTGDEKDSAKIAAKLARDKIIELYETKQSFERSIDHEWLGSAENLALKIDGDVNNTSLALALELPDKRVLLFPGDAQVGNWLSWGRQNYPADDKPGGAVLQIEDILARAIFYKVGHHASHNATLRERGLELMTNPRLVAMIPVVEDTAREQKTKTSPGGWAMPYDKLYERLNQRTDGRIIRGDGDTTTEQAKLTGSIFKLSFGADFKAKDPLWAELKLDVG